MSYYLICHYKQLDLLEQVPSQNKKRGKNSTHQILTTTTTEVAGYCPFCSNVNKWLIPPESQWIDALFLTACKKCREKLELVCTRHKKTAVEIRCGISTAHSQCAGTDTVWLDDVSETMLHTNQSKHSRPTFKPVQP